jgi:hypothetical protein
MRGRTVMLLAGLATLAQAKEINLYSMNTGSYVYHLTNNHGQYTENFENHFFSVERKFSEDSKYSLLIGTMNNSFDDRCLALGVRRDWYHNGSGWTFKGVYGIPANSSSTPSSIAAIMAPIKILRMPPGSAFHLIFTMPSSTTLPTISLLRVASLFPACL